MDEFITDIKEITSKKVIVYINDAPSFALYKNEPEKLGLKAGECFTNELKDKIYNELLYKRALNRALGLIRAKDYTCHEIRDKLTKDHYPEDIINKIISELKEKGFLNDARFAENYINLYSGSNSVNIMKMNLIKKGVDKDIIEEAVNDHLSVSPEAEDKLIYKLLESKYEREITFEDEKERYRFRAKVYAFLMRKGFSYEKADGAFKSYFGF